MTIPQNDSIRWLSCMTYNVQAGAETTRFHHYVSRGWRHIVPNRASRATLRRIARLIDEHDLIGLQEIDAGSWRTGQQNQVQRLASLAGFNYWYTQVNRNFGRFAQHGIGLISRIAPRRVTEHQLPGRIPGRGALVARFGNNHTELAVAVAHLSLGAKSRLVQLDALGELLADAEHAVILADTNCSGHALGMSTSLRRLGIQSNVPSLGSYPSWGPKRDLDHILTTPGIETRPARIINTRLSDHRPVCQAIGCPAAIFDNDSASRTQIA